MSAPAAAARLRLSGTVSRVLRPTVRSFASTSTRLDNNNQGRGENYLGTNDPNRRTPVPNVSATNETAVDSMGIGDKPLQEDVADAEKRREMQAPNRRTVWSRSQSPREVAMSGPRFEQTIMEVQPRPYAAIDLIHQQPVRWVDTSSVACDGGGGPLGHPRIFINVDKPQICWCTYCGLPYAHTHHKKLLQSFPKEELSFPLEPSNNPNQVQMPQTKSQKGTIQGQYPQLQGEVTAEGEGGQPFSQR